MNRFLGVVLFFGIMLLGFIGFAQLMYVQKSQQELEELHLTYAIDNAVDAAMEELLLSYDLGLDYAEPSKVTLKPEDALNAFTETFLLNYNLPTTPDNKIMVQSEYLPVFVVAAYDGFYLGTYDIVRHSVDVASPAGEIKDVERKFIFKPKKPYTYVDAGNVYALNFGAENYIKVFGGSNIVKEKGTPPNSRGRVEVLRRINRIVSEEIAYTIEEMNRNNGEYHHQFYIPTGLTTVRGSQLMEGPSIIAIIQNVQLNTMKPVNAFSVAGGKVTGVRYIALYEKNGVKYYAYADQVQGDATINVTDLVVSMKEATLKGHFPDVVRLGM